MCVCGVIEETVDRVNRNCVPEYKIKTTKTFL